MGNTILRFKSKSGNWITANFANPQAALIYAVDSGAVEIQIDSLSFKQRVERLTADVPHLFPWQAEDLVKKVDQGRLTWLVPHNND